MLLNLLPAEIIFGGGKLLLFFPLLLLSFFASRFGPFPGFHIPLVCLISRDELIARLRRHAQRVYLIVMQSIRRVRLPSSAPGAKRSTAQSMPARALDICHGRTGSAVRNGTHPAD